MSLDTHPLVTIHTDGACSGNPGPGGWAALLECDGQRLELSGGETQTTNNRMELQAAIMALQALKRPCRITLVSDSTYLVDAFRLDWIGRWQRNSWRTSRGAPVENTDLWHELIALTSNHRVEFRKTKGHAGDQRNEFCDRLARAAIPAVSS